MVRLLFVTSIEAYSASAFLFISSYRAELIQNLPAGRQVSAQLVLPSGSRKPWPLGAI